MVEYPIKNVKLYNDGDKEGNISPVDFYYITQHHNRESLKTLRNPIIKRWSKTGYVIHRISYKYQNYIPYTETKWYRYQIVDAKIEYKDILPHTETKWYKYPIVDEKAKYKDMLPPTETKWYKYTIADKKAEYKYIFPINLWDTIIYEHFSLQEFIHLDEWQTEGRTPPIPCMDLKDKVPTKVTVSIVVSGHSYSISTDALGKAYIGINNLEIKEQILWDILSLDGDQRIESVSFAWSLEYKQKENLDISLYWESDKQFKLVTTKAEYILLTIEQENKEPLQRWIRKEITSQQQWYRGVITISYPIGWKKHTIVDKVDKYNDIIPTTEWIKEMILYEWVWYRDWIVPTTPAPSKWEDEYEHTERIIVPGAEWKDIYIQELKHQGNAKVHIDITWEIEGFATLQTYWAIYINNVSSPYYREWAKASEEDHNINFTKDNVQHIRIRCLTNRSYDQDEVITNIKITVTQT